MLLALANPLHNGQYALVTEADRSSARHDSWKPEGWDEWPQKRRTLWRRERQADLMEHLEVDAEEARVNRDRLVEHLRREAAELRRQITSDNETDLHA